MIIRILKLSPIEMNYRDRIIADHRIMLGKPIVRGTRITVEVILRKLSEGANPDDVVSMYPNLAKEDVQAALDYASEVISNEDVIDLSN